jgi:hypothetical protein
MMESCLREFINRISSVADLEPNRFRKLDPDLHQSRKLEALEGYFRALEGSNLE